MPSISLVTQAWEEAFHKLFAQVKREFILVAPFIGLEPIRSLCRILQAKDTSIAVHCVTNFAPQALARGSLRVDALLQLLTCNPETHIYHLGNLHAKVYLADEQAALLTSANFTEAGLNRNAEVGLWLAEPTLLHALHRYIQKLRRISTPLSEADLRFFAEKGEQLRESFRPMKSTEARLPEAERIQERLIRARLRLARSDRERVSENQIFAATILHLLEEKGPLRTQELHPLIQALHPELCDDSVERIIDGVRFGKRWKHMVRNAQQYLKRNGLIGYDAQTQCWFLRSSTNSPRRPA